MDASVLPIVAPTDAAEAPSAVLTSSVRGPRLKEIIKNINLKIREKENLAKEKKREEAQLVSDWSVSITDPNWMPSMASQTTIRVIKNKRDEANDTMPLINNLINNINSNISDPNVEMEYLDSTFRALTAENTPPIASRTRSNTRTTHRTPSKPSSIHDVEAPDNNQLLDSLHHLDVKIDDNDNNSNYHTQYNETRIPTEFNSASFQTPRATSITVLTASLPQNATTTILPVGSASSPRSAHASIMGAQFNSIDLAKALGSQNILAARKECQTAVEKAPLTSKDPSLILTFLRTLKATLNKFVDPTGNSGLPYRSLDEAFADGVTQTCFQKDAYAIFEGLIQTNPPTDTFDGFANAIKALYCSGHTDQMILGTASFFRWHVGETPADASLRLSASLTSLTTPCPPHEVKRFFIFGCREVYPELHERLLSFEFKGKIWTDPTVPLGEIVKYCNVKCKHLWAPRSSDRENAGALSAMMEKMEMMGSLLLQLQQNQQPPPPPISTRSYERPRRNIVSYAQSMGFELSDPTEFSTALTIFTSNVGPPTEDELIEFNRDKNLVLSSFNRNMPPYATGVPSYGRGFSGNCFVCEKPGHRFNECELLNFAKTMGNNELFTKWKETQNKGNDYIFPTKNITDTPLKHVNETVSLVLASDVSLSDPNLLNSFSNKTLLDSTIPDSVVLSTFELLKPVDLMAPPPLIEPLNISKGIVIDLSSYNHIAINKPQVNLPVSPSKDDAPIDILSTSPVTFDLHRSRGKATVLWTQCRITGLYIEQTLLDSGADCNIVEVSFINLLNRRYKRNIRVYNYRRKHSTEGIGGETAAIGYCDLTISPGNNRGLVSRVFRFTVVEHSPVPFILGMPVITEFNMDISTSTNTLAYYDFVKGVPTKLLTPMKVCTESFTTRFDGHSPYIRVMVAKSTVLDVGPKGSSGSHQTVTCTLSRVPTHRHDDYLIHTTPLLHSADITGASCIYSDRQLFTADYQNFEGPGFPDIKTVIRGRNHGFERPKDCSFSVLLRHTGNIQHTLAPGATIGYIKDTPFDAINCHIPLDEVLSEDLNASYIHSLVGTNPNVCDLETLLIAVNDDISTYKTAYASDTPHSNPGDSPVDKVFTSTEVDCTNKNSETNNLRPEKDHNHTFLRKDVKGILSFCRELLAANDDTLSNRLELYLNSKPNLVFATFDNTQLIPDVKTRSKFKQRLQEFENFDSFITDPSADTIGSITFIRKGAPVKVIAPNSIQDDNPDIIFINDDDNPEVDFCAYGTNVDPDDTPGLTETVEIDSDSDDEDDLGTRKNPRDTTDEDKRDYTHAPPTADEKILETLENGMDHIHNPEFKKKLLDLLKRYINCFRPEVVTGTKSPGEHSVELFPNAKIPSSHPYHEGLERAEIIRTHIKKMLEDGIIQHSRSHFSSPVTLAKKKDGTLRFCTDFRKLNKVTVPDKYPLPRIDETFNMLRGSVLFSSLDLLAGFWQIKIKEEDIPKTAFVTGGGFYEYKVMPFGLINSPATFQRIMDMVLAGLKWVECMVYIDDIIIFSKDEDEHLKRLEHVFERLMEYNLKVKPSKCQFAFEVLPFLGHVVSKDGLRKDPDKTRKVRDLVAPTTMKELRQFLGFANYFRAFIPSFSDIAYPLNQLLSGDNPRAKFEGKWTDSCSSAFDRIKQLLVNDVLRVIPVEGDTFILRCDASQMALGAVLFVRRMGENGKQVDLPVAFASRTLNDAEQRYTNTDREGLAVIWACDTFESYTFGKHFKVIVETDHSNLISLFKNGDLKGRFARYAYALHDYDFELIHRPGKSMVAPDFFSRYKAETDIDDDVISTIPDEQRICFGTRSLGKEAEEDLKRFVCISLENESTYDKDSLIHNELEDMSPLFSEINEELFTKISTLDPSPFQLEGLNVISWNVNGLWALCTKLLKLERIKNPTTLLNRAEVFVQYLDQEKIDIACLQETKLGAQKESTWQHFHELTGWIVFSNECRTGSNGVMTLVRKGTPVLAVQEGELESSRFEFHEDHKWMPNHDRGITGKEGRCLTVTFPSLTIVNIYVPNGTRSLERLDTKAGFCDSLKSYCQQLVAMSNNKVLIIGDFNILMSLDDAVPPEDPKCEVTQYSTFRTEEREWLHSLTNLGFYDGFRITHPTSNSKTWYDPMSKRGILRIDFALIDKRLPMNWRVDHNYVKGLSDHAQLRIEFESPESALFVTSDRMLALPALHDGEDLDLEDPEEMISDTKVLSESHAEILRLQRRDPNFGPVIHALEHGVFPEDDSKRRSTLNYMKSCVMRHGLLYFVSETPHFDIRRGPVRRALCVPSPLRKRILHLMHDDMMAGHFGMDKLRPTILDRFWWPLISKDFTDHIKGCLTCQQSKDTPKRVGFLKMIPIGKSPWERVGVDIMSKLKTTQKGNKHIVVITCYFTRWVEAYPMPAADAMTVARTIVEQCFLRLGVPLIMQSDQGQPFVSELVQRVLQVLGLRQGLSTPYWPQAMGLTERANKTVGQIIRAYINQMSHRDWDDILPYIMFAIRVAFHGDSKQTPFFGMFLRHPRLPVDLQYGITSDDAFIQENGEPLRVLTSLIKMDENTQTMLNTVEMVSVARTTPRQPSIGCILTDDIKKNLRFLAAKILPKVGVYQENSNDELSYRQLVFSKIMKLNGFDILYVRTSSPPGDMPYILGVGRFEFDSRDKHRQRGVKILPSQLSLTQGEDNVIKATAGRYIYIYSTRHLNKVVPMKTVGRNTTDYGKHHFTRATYVDAEGDLYFENQCIIDHTKSLEDLRLEMNPILEFGTIGLYRVILHEVMTKVYLTINDNLDEIQAVNPNYDVKDYAYDVAQFLQASRNTVIKEMAKEQAKVTRGVTPFQPQVGDLVWITVPLKTEKKGETKDSLPRKFKFRWTGPVRVISASEDNNRFTVVETFPDNTVISRLVNSARIKPYIPSYDGPPVESAARYSNCDDDFENEIKNWETARIRKVAPRYRMARGTHPELLRRIDPDWIDIKFDEKEFQLEMLVDHRMTDDNQYQYFVKWLGYHASRNTWVDEDQLPKAYVVEFWLEMQTRNKHAYDERVEWLSTHRRRRVRRTFKPAPNMVEPPKTVPKMVIELPRNFIDDDISEEETSKTILRRSRRLGTTLLVQSREFRDGLLRAPGSLITLDDPQGPWDGDQNKTPEEYHEDMIKYGLTVIKCPYDNQVATLYLRTPSGKTYRVTAFVDNGCSVSMMSYELAALLQLKRAGALTTSRTTFESRRQIVTEYTEKIEVWFRERSCESGMTLHYRTEFPPGLHFVLGLNLMYYLKYKLEYYPPVDRAPFKEFDDIQNML